MANQKKDGARSDHAHLHRLRALPSSCAQTLPQTQHPPSPGSGPEPAQLLPRFQAPPHPPKLRPLSHPFHIVPHYSNFPQARSPSNSVLFPHHSTPALTRSLHPPFRLHPAPLEWSLSGVSPLTLHLQLTLFRMTGRWSIIQPSPSSRLFIHSFIHSCLSFHSFIHRFPIHSLQQSLFTHLLMFSFTHSLFCSAFIE